MYVHVVGMLDGLEVVPVVCEAVVIAVIRIYW